MVAVVERAASVDRVALGKLQVIVKVLANSGAVDHDIDAVVGEVRLRTHP